MPARVLSVGQCGYDHGQIAGALKKAFGAETVAAASAEEALSLLGEGGFALVLVNRVFDADGALGLDFIDRVKKKRDLAGVPLMLVSNFEDAQRQAQEKGALAGFGKAALNQPATLERLRPLLS